MVDGVPVGSIPADNGVAAEFFPISTANLIPGTHTLTVQYSGDPVYSPATTSTTFTVGPAPLGTEYACALNGQHDFTGFIEAVANAPSLAPSGSSVPVSSLDLTFNGDVNPLGSYPNPLIDVAVGLSPGNSTVTASDTTSTVNNGNVSASWTGLSGTVPITGNPGTVVNVGISVLTFTTDGEGGDPVVCTPAAQPAVAQQITVSGTTLTASPSGSAAVGAPVTLTATVNPTPSDLRRDPFVGQVDFFDGATDIGTVRVSSVNNPGGDPGVATLTTTSLTPGDHTLTAVWSGGPTPAQTSAPVNFQVGTAPTVTTQPTNQTASGRSSRHVHRSSEWEPDPNGSVAGVQRMEARPGPTSAGATSDSYTTPATTASDNGNQYQAVFSNAAGPAATTNPATLTVLAPSTTGYRLVASNGAVSTFGNAGNYGSEAGQSLNAPIVGMAATPDNKGYWLVGADGGIFTFGDAGYYGSEGGQHLNQPIVGMAATPDGKGYWLVAADGGIFTFGDAAFYGSEGGQHLNAPVVGMAATPDGGGYWLVASDGGIFTFGDATFYGSEGGQSLNAPVVGMAATPSGNGYWLVAKDGGVFTFGDATFNGSASGQSNAPVVGIVPTSNGGGYWLGASDGGIFTFGNAPFNGSGAGNFTASVVAIAP